MKKVILSLDLSTTCTGWAVLDEDRKLIAYGILKPKVKGVAKLKYPRQQLEKMKSLAQQVLELIWNYLPEKIVIEEITGSKSRMTQKTLDGYHYILLAHIEQFLDIIHYQDVSGSRGWRTGLRLRLSDADKEFNREAKKLNKSMGKGHKKINKIGPKHLAARYVNAKFNMNLDVDNKTSDADIADAIAMGYFFVRNMIK